MTTFDESKLSKVIARRIIVPEDRSQLLPLSTPIYCPDNNGVKASRVTIINPNSNSFYTDASRPGYVNIGSNLTKNDARLRSFVVNNGDVTINEIGEATGFGIGKYLSIDDADTIAATKEVHVTGFIPKGITSDVDLFAMSGNDYQIMLEVTQNGNINLTIRDGLEESYDTVGTAKFDSYINLTVSIDDSDANDRVVTFRALGLNEDGSLFTEEVVTSKTNITLFSFGTGTDANYQMDLANSAIVNVNGATVKFYDADTTVSVSPANVSNTIDIDLAKTVRVNYFLPQEVDLKADFGLMDMIKSDFAVRFKKAVSNEILAQIEVLVDGGTVTELTMGATLAETCGNVIADNISNGTGQKYSIYKYNNGAPVTYIESSNQPNIDDKVMYKSDDTETCDPMMFRSDYATKDDVQVPALYYCERPTLILPGTTFAEYQEGLCNGDIRTYVEDKINVDTAAIDFNSLGEGIFGSNDVFAVAFTQPSIKSAPDTNYFATNICVEVYFGVKLVNASNLRVLASGE